MKKLYSTTSSEYGFFESKAEKKRHEKDVSLKIIVRGEEKKFLGIELNPEYVKIAEERLKPYLEQKNFKDFDEDIQEEVKEQRSMGDFD